MFLLKQFLPAAILAMVVAAALSGVALLCRRERVQGVLVSFALALGYAAGHFLITGVAKIPPADTTNWLPYFALAAAIAAAAGQMVDRQLTRLVVFGLVSVGALRLLLAPIFRNTWSTGEGWLWVICLAFAIVLVAVILDALKRSAALPIELPLSLLIVSAGTAGALTLSGSLLLGQFAAVLAASVFGSLVTTVRGVVGHDGFIAVSSLLLVALLLCGYFFAELPAICVVLLATAPALAVIPSRMSPSYKRAVVRLALVSAPVAAALILAFRSSPPLDY